MGIKVPLLVSFAAIVLCSCTPSKPVAKDMSSERTIPAVRSEDPLEIGFQNLVTEIVEGLNDQRAKKIAVMQFQQLDGKVTQFGGYLAEEMITRLYRTGSFQVVEREMLNQVMAEHELATSGLVDESTAKELGKILGVDAIATGTITDFGTEVRVNSRLIETETGAVFSAAATTLPKDDRIRTLMSKTLVSAPSRRASDASDSNPDGSGTSDLEMEPGLYAEYYNLSSGQREIPVSGPVYAEIAPSITANWGTGSPVPRVKPNFFGVRWTGYILIDPPGLYSLSFNHDDILRVWIDDKLVYNGPGWTQGRFRSIDTTFERSGWLPLKVEFIELGDKAVNIFRWAKPGAAAYDDVRPEFFRHDPAKH